ncbi:hypothetical protein FRC18_001157 [Serendipita sp. 400]|nr:hypothetical protein FRC18_001157 [Serendipita sp. 400]
MSSKLNLKETPAEREKRIAKEERRAARKRQKRGPELHFNHFHEPDARQWHLSEPTIFRTPEDVDAAYLPRSQENEATSEQTAKDYEKIQKELEEANFRAKLFDEMGEDERIDSIEARFNAYRVPNRWARTGANNNTRNPNDMDEDEYAEWVRRGMWERHHKQEVEEQERREKEKEARKEHERKLRRESRRLEEEARERRKQREILSIRRQFDSYQTAWASLTSRESTSNLRFGDIPWPMTHQPRYVSDITKEAISDFLLSAHHSPDKSTKKRIREALFIYHPDRFEKWTNLAQNPTEREIIQEAADKVVRILNSLGGE